MIRILIAEDEQRIASFIDKGLSAAGYTTTVVGDGASAYEYARGSQFDLIILDLELPVRDGLRSGLSSAVPTPSRGLTMVPPGHHVSVNDPFELQRFVFVEPQDTGGAYARAVSELRAGRKMSNWMRFVSPQIAGLGRSPTAHRRS
jgi:Protein of unknown function (DUF1810)/Response regulator receiver domain